MSNNKLTLDQRRTVLLAQCALQRMEAAQELAALSAPLSGGGGLKLPLTVIGVVMGMVAMKPGRALPMLTAGLSLLKLGGTVLSLLRSGRHARE